jgi:glutaredoxin
MKLKAIHVVYANWCPHCVPTTVEPMKRIAEELGIPIYLYDIDTEAVKKADELVKKYGDWSEDYIIPQVFFEFNDGEIKHVLTGYSEGVSYTKKAVENLLRSEYFLKIRKETKPS